MANITSASLIIFLLLSPCLAHSKETYNNRRSEILSRRRRYVAFPVGATFSMAACMTVGVLGQPSKGIFTWGLNWGISYNLPNQTDTVTGLKRLKKLPHQLVTRSARSDFYTKLELVMNDMGYKGRECIYRALCEAAQRLMPRGKTIVEELFRSTFTLPLSPVLGSEPMKHHLYDAAHREGLHQRTNCKIKYRGCPVSLLDLVLGYYNPIRDNNIVFM